MPAKARSPPQAIDEIAELLGNDFRKRLTPLASSRWAHDPFALGSYSHALPHHADDREMLAEPVDNRIFFAGEATSPNFFSTAHGARDSGERAADEVVGIFDLTPRCASVIEQTVMIAFVTSSVFGEPMPLLSCGAGNIRNQPCPRRRETHPPCASKTPAENNCRCPPPATSPEFARRARTQPPQISLSGRADLARPVVGMAAAARRRTR